MIRSIVILPLVLATSLFAQPVDDKDLLDRMVVEPTVKTFLRMVAKAGMIERLKGEAPLTIFVPNDAAFAKLPPGAVDALFKDKAALRKFVFAHIVPGRVTVKDLKEGPLKTIGDPLNIKLKGGLTVNGQKILTPDVVASNGVIQVMPGMLLKMGS